MSTNQYYTQLPNVEYVNKDNVVMGKKLTTDENLNSGTAVFDTLSQNPDIVGMIDAETGERKTFAEMRDQTIRCALWLEKQGVSENDVVGISTPIQMNDYVPYLATLYINAIVNPWHYDASVEHAQHFIEICRPKVIFACDQSIDKLVVLVKIKKMNCQFVTYSSHPTYQSLHDIMSEQTQQEIDDFKCTIPLDPPKKVSQIIFSSGTTSTPKAIMHSYQSVFMRKLDKSPMRRSMTYLWYSTLAWITCGIMITANIRLQSTRIVHRAFEVEATARFIEKYKINHVFLRPYLMMLCHQAKIFTRYDFTHVEVINLGGTKTNKLVLEDCQKNLPHTFICSIYGTTEAGGALSRLTKNCKHIDSLGYPVDGVKLKIVDPTTGIALGPNQNGEIYFKSNNAMLGYVNDPDETKKAMNEEGWWKSGDIGYYDEDGEFFIVDRLKAMIKMKFYTLSSIEFEEALMTHPDVDDCAVVGVEHPIDIERPFIFIVKARDAKMKAEDVIEFAASKNERYRLIGGLAFVDNLPYTHSGKKQLRKLQAMAKGYVEQHNISD